MGARLTQVMRWAYWWNSTEPMPDEITNEQVLIALNTDFSTKGLASQDIQVIVGAWQAGAISRDTVTDLFRRGEVLPEGRSMEEELKLIAESAPPTTAKQQVLVVNRQNPFTDRVGSMKGPGEETCTGNQICQIFS